MGNLVQDQVIPRLNVALGISHHESAPAEAPVYTSMQVDQLVAWLQQDKPQDTREFVQSLVNERSGRDDALFLELFAPAARLIGELWSSDEWTFAEVTMGVARLQMLVRAFGSTPNARDVASDQQRVAVFAEVPGEQHTFGLTLVEEFFRRAGWEVIREPSGGLEARVAARSITMVGLTVSELNLLDSLTDLIRSVRAASINPDLLVMVGGQCFHHDPELVQSVGADVSAIDARRAVEAARTLLEQRAKIDEAPAKVALSAAVNSDSI